MLTAGDLRTVLVPTPVKTAAYTAHHGDFVLVDTTAASVTVTLPLNPPQNAAVGLKQVATASGHTVTVAAPGASSFNLQGGATTLTLTLLSQGVILQYCSGVWVVQSDDLPLAQLDARYAAMFSAAGDPMKIGFPSTYISPNPVGNTTFADGANSATYLKLRAGGYPMSNWTVNVTTSSGNISAGAYAAAGTGAASKPAVQYASSGAIACPAGGIATIALGSTFTPALGDFAALSCDNTTAAVQSLATGANNSLSAGISWVQATAHPLPSVPGTLASDFFTVALMKGS